MITERQNPIGNSPMPNARVSESAATTLFGHDEEPCPNRQPVLQRLTMKLGGRLASLFSWYQY